MRCAGASLAHGQAVPGLSCAESVSAKQCRANRVTEKQQELLSILTAAVVRVMLEPGARYTAMLPMTPEATHHEGDAQMLLVHPHCCAQQGDLLDCYHVYTLLVAVCLEHL